MYVPLRTNQLVALLTERRQRRVVGRMPDDGAAGGGRRLSSLPAATVLIEARAEADGRAQWRRPVAGRVASLDWDTGWLFASTEAGPLLAIRATDGEVLWQRDLGSPLSGAPPAPSGDRLYLGLKDGRVLAMSLQTGEEIWTQKLAESAAGILPVADRVFVGARTISFTRWTPKTAMRLAISNRRRSAGPARARRAARVFHRARQHPSRAQPQ